jgi:formylglycine-generating enzyme required for sulfatase activity
LKGDETVPLPEMIEIPAGLTLLGLPERPRDFSMPHRWSEPQEIYVAAFKLGKFPVTRQEYETFLDAMNREAPLDWDDPLLMDARSPVCGVSWEDAQAYCKWLSKASGKVVRLPSADERERAARGGLVGKRFPWGDEDPVDRCCFLNPPDSSPVPVGSFPPNGYGLYDMSGNVWEWLNDLYTEVAPDAPINFSSIVTVGGEGTVSQQSKGKKLSLPPHTITFTGRSPIENRVLVSGSYMTPITYSLWVAYRHEDPPDMRMRAVGFRVAQ